MTAIVVTAAQIGLVNPLKAIVKSYLAGVAITPGEAVYIIAASGSVGLGIWWRKNMLWRLHMDSWGLECFPSA